MIFLPGDSVLVEQGEGALHIKLEGTINPVSPPSETTLQTRKLRGSKKNETIYTIVITRIIEQGRLTFTVGDVVRARESNLKPL